RRLDRQHLARFQMLEVQPHGRESRFLAEASATLARRQPALQQAAPTGFGATRGEIRREDLAVSTTIGRTSRAAEGLSGFAQTREGRSDGRLIHESRKACEG